ncbi:MAG: hypothetical protein JRG86_23570 [Deltaproteobacteria bacterium]|nr:hypothetical protein [Deltaproteobacteria bacterium]MBW2497865.1 hypothetical protein [Deltaproteobacteria bacterium]
MCFRPSEGRLPILTGWLLLLLIDAFLLRWVWIQFGNWGFRDWGYPQSLLEATRIAVVEYGELPLHRSRRIAMKTSPTTVVRRI